MRALKLIVAASLLFGLSSGAFAYGNKGGYQRGNHQGHYNKTVTPRYNNTRHYNTTRYNNTRHYNTRHYNTTRYNNPRYYNTTRYNRPYVRHHYNTPRRVFVQPYRQVNRCAYTWVAPNVYRNICTPYVVPQIVY